MKKKNIQNTKLVLKIFVGMDNLTENILKSFRMRTAFRDFNSNHDKRIHSINFSTNGMTLVSSSNNDLIEIFDCDRGRQVDTISVRKYGCYFVNFAQTSNDVLLISSERRDHVIRSLNIEKKSYLTYFEGHTDVVTSLCVNRHKNLFVSSSSDKTVRLWDVRSPRCEGMCTLKGDVIGAWSGDGQLIAAAIDSESIELFDIRSLENGPISRCKLNKLYNSKCIDMKFSKNSRNILLSTNGPNLLLIDTCYGKELQAYRCNYKFSYIFCHNMLFYLQID